MDCPLLRVTAGGRDTAEAGRDDVRSDDVRSDDGPDEARPALRARALGLGAEVIVAVGAAGLMLFLGRSIGANPLERVDQVSALAAIGLRYTLIGLAIVAVVVVSARWRGGAFHPWSGRLACAGIAGLTSGFVASGVQFALDGTVWPLYAYAGDAGQLLEWIDDLKSGGSMPSNYPPLGIHAISWASDLTGWSAPRALRNAQILGAALFAPVVYTAWRLLLSPRAALVIGVTASMVLIEPYKPYVAVVLAVLVPVLLKLLTVLRDAAALTWRALIVRGVVLGAVLGLLFLTYSGWFVWSAAGAVAGALALLPWRSAPGRGLALLGITGTTLLVVAAPHLWGLLDASRSVQDRYFYFDVYVEPAFITMWFGDLPGDIGVWPPPGELAGVGLFSVLLVVGLGLAVWWAGRRTIVIGLVLLVASAWVMRFWFASQMSSTGSVQLYPRTTNVILYCSLLLVGFAAYFGAGRVRDFLRELPTLEPGGSAQAGRRPVTSAATLGVVAAMLTLGLFMGSATADKLMPSNDRSHGQLAYISQLVRQPDGTCPEHSGPDRCVDTPAEALRIPDGQP